MRLWNTRRNRKLVHSEEWFADLYRTMPIPRPEGPHLEDPGDAFLRQLAQASGKPPLSDPRVKHAAQCPYCLRRLEELRKDVPKRRQRFSPRSMLAFGSSVLAIIIVIAWRVQATSGRDAQVAAAQTFDLSELGATRGEDAHQVPTFHLPRKQAQLTLILPYFSDGGPYLVQVLANKVQPHAVAEASGTATQTGKATVLKVVLDLSHAKPGLYYLATTHASDEAAYYYPVEIAN